MGFFPQGPTLCRACLGLLQATSARLLWNAKGTAVLALTASETDASNKSYYGEQKLHFLAANGSNDSLVPLPKVTALSPWHEPNQASKGVRHHPSAGQ